MLTSLWMTIHVCVGVCVCVCVCVCVLCVCMHAYLWLVHWQLAVLLYFRVSRKKLKLGQDILTGFTVDSSVALLAQAGVVIDIVDTDALMHARIAAAFIDIDFTCTSRITCHTLADELVHLI